MNLTLAIQDLPEAREAITLKGELAGQPWSAVHECNACDREGTITDLLLFHFTRRCEEYVTTAMELAPKGDWALQGAVDHCAMLVLLLDGVTDRYALSRAEAAREIAQRLPVYYRLVGKSTWSGFAARNAEFDALTTLAATIEKRIAGTGGDIPLMTA